MNFSTFFEEFKFSLAAPEMEKMPLRFDTEKKN